LAKSSQQEETLEAAGQSYTIPGPQAPKSANDAESSKQKETTSVANSAQTRGLLGVNREREMTRQTTHPQELQKVQGGLATSSQDLERQPSPLSMLMKAMTTFSEKTVQLLQVLREDMTFQNQGMIGECCGIKESHAGGGGNYHIWKQKIIATISLKGSYADRVKGLAKTINKKGRFVRDKSLFRNDDSQKYAFLIAEDCAPVE
jgi:hypothetical protein